MFNKVLYACIAIIIITGVIRIFISNEDVPADVPEAVPIEEDATMCTMDAMQCPDGSYVGRTGPNCEFVCPDLLEVSADILSHIDSKAGLIQLTTPVPTGVVQSPLGITGQARGYWFFEASFPIVLTNWDGLIIAEGFATAEGDWMTEEFVPFTATLEFVSPYQVGDPDFMKNGTLILQKDNPSDLPENDNALEIPIRFAS